MMIPTKTDRWMRFTTNGLAVVALLIALVVAVSMWSSRLANDDWERAGEVVAAEVADSDLVIVLPEWRRLKLSHFRGTPAIATGSIPHGSSRYFDGVWMVYSTRDFARRPLPTIHKDAVLVSKREIGEVVIER